MTKKSTTLDSVDFTFTSTQLWLLTAVTVIGYFVFSFFSDGFYQHDEAAHFINMKTFWHNPNIILGNWAKPGYKLLMVIPSLAGTTAVLIVNCLFAAGTAFLTYKLAEQLELKFAGLAFILMATQPLWLQLSFRNYSELPTAFLITLALWLFFKDRFVANSFGLSDEKKANTLLYATLTISYLTLLRQEFYVIGTALAAWLLLKKQWKLIPLLAVFPILINVWGWATSGDPFYLITSTFGTAEAYKNGYPRQGFDHYFIMLTPIVGPVVVLGFLISLVELVRLKVSKLVPVLTVASIYFLLHCVFNWQSVTIGASTGGNLRYIVVIGSQLSILALFGINQIKTLKKLTKPIWVISTLYIVLVAAFLSFKHNNLHLTTERDFAPFIVLIAGFLVLLFVKEVKWWILSLVVIQTFYLVTTIEPYKLSPEDKTMKQVVDWAEKNRAFDYPTMMQHTLFYYYTGKVQQDFKNGAEPLIVQETIDASKPGTIIFWDSHYSYRPNLRATSVNYNYFTERPKEYKLLGQFLSTDQRFGVFVFQKL